MQPIIDFLKNKESTKYARCKVDQTKTIEREAYIKKSSTAQKQVKFEEVLTTETDKVEAAEIHLDL